MCITGFVGAIDALTVMVPELLKHQEYILTYKFSQDHLELLFNGIRRAGMLLVMLDMTFIKIKIIITNYCNVSYVTIECYYKIYIIYRPIY
jgi:hypothetical protein